MASEWHDARFAQLCEHSAFGPRFAGELYAPDGNVATLRTTDISADGRIEYETMPLARLDLSRLQQHTLRPKDLVITRSGRIGTAALFNGFRLPVLPGAFLIRFRLKTDVAEPLFYRYFFNSRAGQELLTSVATGSVQQNLNITSVHGLEVPVPPLADQRAIAHILGTLDDKIELNRRMNETLERQARALFKSWFVDFDPVRAKMSGEPPESICQRLGLTPDLLALFPDRLIDSELGEIPEGWSASTLGSHIEIFDSKRVPLSNREREKRKGIYPYYGATSVMDHVDDFIFDGIYVLIGEDGSVVKENGEPFLQYVWGKFWVNNHAHVLQAKKPVSNEHLLLMLKQTNVASFVTGAVQLKISQGNLKRIPFVSATEPLIKNFAKIIAPLFDMIRAREDEIKILIEERDALLPKLLSGELRVPDLEGKLRVTA